GASGRRWPRSSPTGGSNATCCASASSARSSPRDRRTSCAGCRSSTSRAFCAASVSSGPSMSDLEARAPEIRRIAVSLIHDAGSGRPGSCLSAADLLATLYFRELRDGRDRFVLSKGHACPALYAALYLRGYFDRATL